MSSEAKPIIILASTSTYRQELLRRICPEFEVKEPIVEETPLDQESAVACAKRLSIAKAGSVAELQTVGRIVIGSDQVADCEGRWLSKPGTTSNAIDQLQYASGRTAVFYTGLCVWNTNTHRYDSEVINTEVKFRDLELSAIERYVAKEDVLGCAGSAKSEGLGITLLDSILGDDPTALVGLPLIALSRILRRHGITLP
ncbi:MAG: septum formation protein Maf [Burkholderiales bacterium]|nr:septum formation protein Maf [Burkholderiales bacterium]OUT78543.1 MAG: septum formation protein Maf [Betaproteobacteria bacterium TMED22]|tara:strand:- start:7098 stop:7694 length:597 start_codon:yes stop_codon:yes gene_type:complete